MTQKFYTRRKETSTVKHGLKEASSHASPLLHLLHELLLTILRTLLIPLLQHHGHTHLAEAATRQVSDDLPHEQTNGGRTRHSY